MDHQTQKSGQESNITARNIYESNYYFTDSFAFAGFDSKIAPIAQLIFGVLEILFTCIFHHPQLLWCSVLLFMTLWVPGCWFIIWTTIRFCICTRCWLQLHQQTKLLVSRNRKIIPSLIASRSLLHLLHDIVSNTRLGQVKTFLTRFAILKVMKQKLCRENKHLTISGSDSQKEKTIWWFWAVRILLCYAWCY